MAGSFTREVVILGESALKCKNERLSTILNGPIYYIRYTPELQCIAYLAAHSAQLHVKQVLHSICILQKR